MAGRLPQTTPPSPIRRVFQEHEDGCGIACVAMLAGISYATARNTIFGGTETEATSFADLRVALLVHGVRLPRAMTPFWEGWYTELHQPALLAVNPGANGMWHWAVWDGANRRILDPLRWPPRSPVVVGYCLVARGRTPHQQTGRRLIGLLLLQPHQVACDNWLAARPRSGLGSPSTPQRIGRILARGRHHEQLGDANRQHRRNAIEQVNGGVFLLPFQPAQVRAVDGRVGR